MIGSQWLNVKEKENVTIFFLFLYPFVILEKGVKENFFSKEYVKYFASHP